MYGYVRPDRAELRCREYELYQSAYCGLCHSLGRRCGLFARFTVSYDLAFLSMLICGEEIGECALRCPRHLLKKRRCLRQNDASDEAALRGMILYWWKLQDARADEGGWKRLGATIVSLLLRPGYRKAAAALPEYDELVKDCLSELSVLEKAGSDSIDRTADCFARILSGCVPEEGSRQRILRELLYHVGRCVYLMDAADDLEADREKGRYNPLLKRFPAWDESARETLRQSLVISEERAQFAFNLLEENVFTEINRNILTLGLPEMRELVLTGAWKQRKKLTKEYSHRMER